MGPFSRLAKEHIVAPPGFNRWKVPPASIAIHLCIGSVYAWSVFNTPLTRLDGVAAQAAGDWNLGTVKWIFSIAILFLGLSAAVAGKWLERVGPRMVGVTAAFCWGGGFLIGALGITTRQLWLVYLGYGALGGCGLGLAYVSPVSTLIRWFPDRRGMATGMAIMGFGGGAFIAAPIKEALLSWFGRAPQVVGAFADVTVNVSKAGVSSVQINGVAQEVVVAINDAGVQTVYLVGSGSTGAAMTFVTLGVVYFVVMMIAAFAYRVPAEGWTPEGWTPDTTAQSRKMISQNHVGIDQALKTPQFYLLWLVLCLNVTAGIAVLGVAKTMMTEIFGSALPNVVGGTVLGITFTGLFVSAISLFNMAGRFFWSSASDKLGRKNTYHVFFILGIILYLFIPFTAISVSKDPQVLWLVVFYAVSMVIFTMYGGGFATIPAYLADIFGTRFVGGIHGRLLTAWSTAGVLGPMLITQLRERSLWRSIQDLAGKVEPDVFQATFGLPVGELRTLYENNAVTIDRLMSIVPEGTTDPSPYLYNTTMYVMAGLLAVALLANILVPPVHEKHHIKDEPVAVPPSVKDT